MYYQLYDTVLMIQQKQILYSTYKYHHWVRTKISTLADLSFDITEVVLIADTELLCRTHEYYKVCIELKDYTETFTRNAIRKDSHHHLQSLVSLRGCC